MNQPISIPQIDWTPQQIKRFRKHLRWTQEFMADALKVSTTTVSRWETGLQPSMRGLRALDDLAARVRYDAQA